MYFGTDSIIPILFHNEKAKYIWQDDTNSVPALLMFITKSVATKRLSFN